MRKIRRIKVPSRTFRYLCTLKDNSSDKFEIEERKLLFGAMLEGSKLLDKAILTIAAGAYGLSLTMLSSFQPIKKGTIFYLQLAWIFLGITIMSTLISFITSQCACRENIECLNNRKSDNSNNKWSKITSCINWITIVMFTLGLIFLTFFGFLNISQKEGSIMSDKNLKKIEEGFVPPKVPPEESELRKGFVPPPPKKPPVEPPKK